MAPTAESPDDSAPAAPAPTCARCGAPLPITLASEDVACAHCGEVATMDAALRARMRAYVGDVRAFLDDELSARFTAAAYGQSATAKRPVLIGAVGVAFAVTFGAIAVVASSGGARIPWSAAAILAALWLASLAAFTRGWSTLFAVPRPAALAAQSIAKCATCGAVREIPAGRAAVECRHCGGTLLVPVRVAEQLLAETRAAAASAVAAERARLVTGDYGQGMVKPLVAAVVAGVPVAGALGVWLVTRATDATPIASTAALLAIFLAPLALALPLLVAAPIRGRDERRHIAPLVEQLVAAAGYTDQPR